MSSDIPESPVVESGPTAIAISLTDLVLCNNDHGYDAQLSRLCPKCGARERLSVARLLSPNILAPRILLALVRAQAGSVPIELEPGQTIRVSKSLIADSEPKPFLVPLFGKKVPDAG